MATKKQKRNISIVVGVLVLLIIINSQINLLTVFGARPQLQCSLSGEDISCFVYRGTDGNFASQIFIDGELAIDIAKPSGVSERRSLIINNVKANSGIAFSDWICAQSTPCCEDWESKATCINAIKNYVSESLGQQIMIIEGKVLEMRGDDTRNAVDTGTTTKTYAFGTFDRNDFVIQDPFPDEPERKYVFVPTSFIIKSKVGGYTEADVCTEFDLACLKITIFRLQNNECTELIIKEKDKTFNDYLTLTECESKIMVRQDFYRLEDNQCTQINIFPSEKTEFDFNTQVECEENISKPFLIVLIIVGILVSIGGLIWLLKFLGKK